MNNKICFYHQNVLTEGNIRKVTQGNVIRIDVISTVLILKKLYFNSCRDKCNQYFILDLSNTNQYPKLILFQYKKHYYDREIPLFPY